MGLNAYLLFKSVGVLGLCVLEATRLSKKLELRPSLEPGSSASAEYSNQWATRDLIRLQQHAILYVAQYINSLYMQFYQD